MTLLPRLTLRGRLRAVVALTTGTALVLAFAMNFVYERVNHRRRMVEDLEALAGVIAANSTAALALGDREAARETLASVRLQGNVVSVVLLDGAGRPLGSYRRDGSPTLVQDRPEPEGLRFEGQHARLFRRVTQGDRFLGTLFVEYDLAESPARQWRYAGVAALIVLTCGLIAFLLSERLQEAISRPILGLVSAARAVTQDRDFAVRVQEGSHDEIGSLTRAFNEMLAEIESRDAAAKDSEARFRHLAFHDPLTQLPNRALFHDHLNLSLAQARRHETSFAVMFLDLDRFKVVNDSLGHSIGDRLLGTIAERLLVTLRAGDTVARIGGDEFLLLIPDLKKPADAAKLAEKILSAVREPVFIDDQKLFVTGSIGIALFPSDGTDAEALIQNADISMYRAKDAGRDGYQLYTAELHARAQQRMILESQMRAALMRKNFRLHYQPIIRIATGEIIGAEALLRWTHHERGVVSPSEFIPVAEETGLIVPLGDWVLGEACAKVASWDAAGLPPLRIAVNLSARQLSQSGFASKVAACLTANRLAPNRLELEITEGLLMDSAAQINKSIEDLRELGVRLSIDDFGTGFSSLTYVKRFPVSTVKIDRSFIQNIESDPRNAAVARAIIALSHGLGIEVVAEGVESEEELGLLSRERCDGAQGYVFSRPVSSVDFATFAAASAGAGAGAARAAKRFPHGPSGDRRRGAVTPFSDPSAT